MHKLLTSTSVSKIDWMLMEKSIPSAVSYGLSSAGPNSELCGAFPLTPEGSDTVETSKVCKEESSFSVESTTLTDNTTRTVIDEPALCTHKDSDTSLTTAQTEPDQFELTPLFQSSIGESLPELPTAVSNNTHPYASLCDSSSMLNPNRDGESGCDDRLLGEPTPALPSIVSPPSSLGPLASAVNPSVTDSDQCTSIVSEKASFRYENESSQKSDSPKNCIPDVKEAIFPDSNILPVDQYSITQPTLSNTNLEKFSHSDPSCAFPSDQPNAIVSPPLSKEHSSGGTQSSSSPTQIHVCNLCGKRYRHNASLKNHMRKHDSGILASKRFRCNFCVYSSQYKRNVHKHIESIHRNHEAFLHPNIDPQYQTRNDFQARGKLGETRNPEQWTPHNSNQPLLYDTLRTGMPVSRIINEDPCSRTYGPLRGVNAGWKKVNHVNAADTALGATQLSNPLYPGLMQPHSEKRNNSLGSPMSYSSPQKGYQCEIQSCGKTFKTNKSRTLHMVSCHRDPCSKPCPDAFPVNAQPLGPSLCGFPNERRNSLQELLSPDGSDLTSQHRISFTSNRTSPGSCSSEFCTSIDHTNPSYAIKRPFSGSTPGATIEPCPTAYPSNQFMYSSDRSKSTYTDVYSFTDNGLPPVCSDRPNEYINPARTVEFNNTSRTPIIDPLETDSSTSLYTEERLSGLAGSGSTVRFSQDLSTNYGVPPQFSHKVNPQVLNTAAAVSEGNQGCANEGYRDIHQSEFPPTFKLEHSSVGFSNAVASSKIPRTTVEQLLCAPNTSSSVLHAHLTQDTPRQLETCEEIKKAPSAASVDFGPDCSQSFEDIDITEETCTTPYYYGTPEADSDSLAHGHVNSETDAFFTDLEEILAREVPLFDASNPAQNMEWNASGPGSAVSRETGCKSGASSTSKSPASTSNLKPAGSLMSGDSGLESWSSSSSCSAGPNSAPVWGSHEIGTHSKPSPSATTPQSSYPTPTSEQLSAYSHTVVGQSNLEEPYSLASHLTATPGSHRIINNSFSPTIDGDQTYVNNMKNSTPSASKSQQSETLGSYHISKPPLIRDCEDSNYGKFANLEPSFSEAYSNGVQANDFVPAVEQALREDTPQTYLDRRIVEEGYSIRPMPAAHGPCFPKQDDFSSFRGQPVQGTTNPVAYDSTELVSGFRPKAPFYGVNERHGLIQQNNHAFKANVPFGSQDQHLYRLANQPHQHREVPNFSIGGTPGRSLVQQPVSSYANGSYALNEASMMDANGQPHSDLLPSGTLNRELKPGMTTHSEFVQFNQHHQPHPNSGYPMSNQTNAHLLHSDAAINERLGHGSQSFTAGKNAWTPNQMGTPYHTGYQQQPQAYKTYCGQQPYEGGPGSIVYPSEQFPQHFSYSRQSNQEVPMLSQPHRVAAGQVYQQQQQQFYPGTYLAPTQHPVPQPSKSFSSHAHLQRHPNLPMGAYPVHVDYGSGRRPNDAPHNEMYRAAAGEMNPSWAGADPSSTTFASQFIGRYGHESEHNRLPEPNSLPTELAARFDHQPQPQQLGSCHTQHAMSTQLHNVREATDPSGDPVTPMNNSMGPNSTMFVYRSGAPSVCPPGMLVSQQTEWSTSQPSEAMSNTVSIPASKANLV